MIFFIFVYQWKVLVSLNASLFKKDLFLNQQFSEISDTKKLVQIKVTIERLSWRWFIQKTLSIPILNDVWFLLVIGDADYSQRYILWKLDKPVLITIEPWNILVCLYLLDWYMLVLLLMIFCIYILDKNLSWKFW